MLSRGWNDYNFTNRKRTSRNCLWLIFEILKSELFLVFYIIEQMWNELSFYFQQYLTFRDVWMELSIQKIMFLQFKTPHRNFVTEVSRKKNTANEMSMFKMTHGCHTHIRLDSNKMLGWIFTKCFHCLVATTDDLRIKVTLSEHFTICDNIVKDTLKVEQKLLRDAFYPKLTQHLPKMPILKTQKKNFFYLIFENWLEHKSKEKNVGQVICSP